MKPASLDLRRRAIATATGQGGDGDRTMGAKNWDVTYKELQRRNRRAKRENQIMIALAVLAGSGVAWWIFR
jgi:hypothetical protein